MRILIVSQYFWPEAFRINEIASWLAGQGHEVTVLTGKPNYPSGDFFPDFLRDPSVFSSYEGVAIKRLPILRRGRGGRRLLLNYISFALAGLILGPFVLQRRTFDVIFVCLLSPITIAVPAIFLRSLRRIPLAVWVLDLWPQSLQAVGVVKSSAVLGAVAKLVGFIYRNCDLILAQSNSFVEDISKYVPKERSKVLYFPSWPDGPSEQASADVVALDPHVFNIVFTGNIGEAQDFESVLLAASQLVNEAVHWTMVGDGRRADWLKSEIVRRGLDQKITMAGRKAVEAMPLYYQQADALLVSLRANPAFAMTIPAKVQGYLAAGRPILGMLDGEGAQVIVSARAGLAVNAGDHDGLARSVRTLLSAPEATRREMGENGRQYAAQEFDRLRLFQRLESLLAGLATRPR